MPARAVCGWRERRRNAVLVALAIWEVICRRLEDIDDDDDDDGEVGVGLSSLSAVLVSKYLLLLLLLLLGCLANNRLVVRCALCSS